MGLHISPLDFNLPALTLMNAGLFVRMLGTDELLVALNLGVIERENDISCF